MRRLIGKSGDKLLPEVAGIAAESPEGKAITDKRREIFRTRYLPHVSAFPGARRLLEWMRDDGLKLVVASSAQADELRALLDRAGVADLIEDTTSSDDAERSKPDPDIVQAALQRLGLEPTEVVMIGDTPYDIEAAARSGIATIALRTGGWSDRDLAGAIAIYHDPADLLARYDTSPIHAAAVRRH